MPWWKCLWTIQLCEAILRSNIYCSLTWLKQAHHCKTLSTAISHHRWNTTMAQLSSSLRAGLLATSIIISVLAVVSIIVMISRSMTFKKQVEIEMQTPRHEHPQEPQRSDQSLRDHSTPSITVEYPPPVPPKSPKLQGSTESRRGSKTVVWNSSMSVVSLSLSVRLL